MRTHQKFGQHQQHRQGATRIALASCASLLLAAGLSTVNAVVTTSAPAGASGPTVPTTFSYTGQPQTWGPTTSQETIEILAVGAAGGSDFYGGSSSTGGNTPGGYGGAEVATLTVPANTTLSITVGGIPVSICRRPGGSSGASRESGIDSGRPM